MKNAELHRLFDHDSCQRELCLLDMRINEKKSCCIRIGPRCDTVCASITTTDGHKLYHGQKKYDIWGFISRKAGNLDVLLAKPNNHSTDLLMPFWENW